MIVSHVTHWKIPENPSDEREFSNPFSFKFRIILPSSHHCLYILPTFQAKGNMPPQKEMAQKKDDDLQMSSDHSLRINSRPTLEQVIAQQNMQQRISRNQPTPILPRPTPVEQAIQVIPHPRTTSSQRRKRSLDDMKPRTNRCPLPGTKEARDRTLMASWARCKTSEKQRELLRKRGITEEQWKTIQANSKRRSRSKEKRNSRPEESSVEKPEGCPRKQSDVNLPPIGEVLRGSGWGWMDSWFNDSRLIEESMQINRYYSGDGRPHLFCVIARYSNFEDHDNSGPTDYWCVAAARHANLNGNQALLLTSEVLSAIRHNPGPIRCELAKQEFLLLASIIKSCCALVSLEFPEMLCSSSLDHQSIIPS
jgi:hypothetical protein